MYRSIYKEINTLSLVKFNVTLLVEMKDKEFTSHKAKYALQFGTNNNMIGLSLTFKSIKQKIQFSQHSELISFLMFWKVFLHSHQFLLSTLTLPIWFDQIFLRIPWVHWKSIFFYYIECFSPFLPLNLGQPDIHLRSPSIESNKHLTFFKR